jgi:YesN/AraC family two-component response regulator
VRYSLRFYKEKKETLRKMDNFFSSDTNSKKLRWITQTFIALMAMGVIAMLSCIMPKVFMIPFSALYFVFYFFLGMKHLNYIYHFHEYEIVFNTQTESNLSDTPPTYHSLTWEQLEKAITNWENKRYFTESGLTIEQVATQLNTNRTYVSNYVNQVKQQSFKEWINQLRIEEAKRLLLEKPGMHVGEIGMLVGLPDKSNFGRLFSRSTGVSPQTWRKQQKA